ncbi:S-layer homology domain-containing protein [Sporosarcina trichiuri]|uniref:S-layer homology domain-containing protein n=1 Tax=Sporosarcina trichiuri TaxID=3056445 RepID=UPI0025B5C32F|nr:S-layer homology domain-containing protein [Sporosarcina sp. 0.2-SM1T-5]WJY26293.1 S-layer homology domain-containing protein [Sporosarcina sp. 0.2-SM1T-5]
MDSRQRWWRRLGVLAVLGVLIAAILPDQAAAEPFRDVSPAYSEAVSYLTEQQYTNGVAPDLFGTDQPITRGSVAVILARALQLPMPAPGSREFSDVPTRAEQAVAALKTAGIIRGKRPGYFGFDEPVKRGEMALMLSHEHAYSLSGDGSGLTFRDVGSRYAEAVAGLVGAAIAQGKTQDAFGTQDRLKRGEFALFIYRAEMDRITKQLPKTYPDLADKLNSGTVRSIKLIGDSISAGMGADGYQVPEDGRVILEDGSTVYREASFDAASWANAFRTYAGQPRFGDIDFFNAGVSGKTAQWALERADRLMEPREDVVFVMIGTNDRIIGTLAQYERTVRKLLKEADAKSGLLVVMAPPPSANDIGNYRFSPAGINNVLKRISLEEGYLFISHYDAMTAYLKSHPDTAYGDLMETTSPHPTTKGYEVMWDTIRTALQLN